MSAIEDGKMSEWHVHYNNDTGYDDEYFTEWWEITNREILFKSDNEIDAEWLCNILNKYESL